MKKDQQLRKSVLFNCIPYTSKEYLSWLAPLLDTNSLTEKDIFYLFELTDRTFNMLSRDKFNQARDLNSQNLALNKSWLLNPDKDGVVTVPHIVVPSYLSLFDNVLIQNGLGTGNVLQKCWRDLQPRPALTFESYHAYLIECIHDLNLAGSPVVPDWSQKDKKQETPELNSTKVIDFMSKLNAEMRRWNPTFFDRMTDLSSSKWG
jgi:hypothetical protein